MTTDLTTIIINLRNKINECYANNPDFIRKSDRFLDVCKKSINPQITSDDIREMMIQYLATEDVFLTIFDEQYLQNSKLFTALKELINTCLKTQKYDNKLIKIEYFSQKQNILKSVYENFYKTYNHKNYDKLGIVYTPNEVVKFMIESVDYLCNEHFGKLLEDQEVEIIDPCTGIGTFMAQLIDYLKLDKLKYNYHKKIYCNELSILPYFMAKLNIESTYMQKMGEYVEFKNINCVDTLEDNYQENKPIEKNTISIIMGNPPYNANQQNENDNNKNREYAEIDKRIKATYIKESTAQKTKLYDMYSRFFRWGTDRLGDNGILAFITNSSFINARTFDGFRKCVSQDFSYVYIIDLGGDIRGGDKSGNVFNIMVGVAISFMIKKPRNSQEKCKIFYYCLNDCNTGAEKLDFLSKIRDFSQIPFTHIKPSIKYDWINQANTDFEQLLSVGNKHTKLTKSPSQETALFKLFSLGISTARDEWVYDYNYNNIYKKIAFFINIYNEEKQRWHQSDKTVKINDFVQRSIKWTSELEEYLMKGVKLEINQTLIGISLYRPFVKKFIYYDKIIIHRLSQCPQLFPTLESDNQVIIFSSGQRGNFAVLSTNKVFSLDIFLPDATQSLPLYRYDQDGNKIDNITDWGLQQFQAYYQPSPPQPPSPTGEGGERLPTDTLNSPLTRRVRAKITKQDVFYYTYAVLHHPKYRQKYELNLKRDFPKIPFYDNFENWVNWGKQLMDLHLNYESVKPYELKRIDNIITGKMPVPQYKLKADKIKGIIIIDDETTLTGIPAIAFEYLLGNRSALEWILDQYKEKKPKDSTIAEKFNNYKFADYKEQVIDLLMRVCTVSVETMKIIKEMTN